MTTVTLNDGQQAAADAFFRFLMSKDQTFIISGSAGVGKTFLIGHMSNDLMKNYSDACKMMGIDQEYDQVAYTATTNKAAEVLEHALNAPVQTIHSFLGLRVQENYKTGKTNLIKTAAWKQRRGYIIFIEECSMIEKALLDIVIESFPDSKIVFVGDHAQMAPISEKISSIYELVDPVNFVTLTEPVRNANAPALIDLCNQLRKTVETGVFQPISAAPGMVEYLSDNDMQTKLDEHFKVADPSCRVLCYTNDRVQQFNDHIRQDVRLQPSSIQVGDVLVVAQTVNQGTKQSINVEREIVIRSIGNVETADNFTNLFGSGIDLTYRPMMVALTSDKYGGGIPVNVPCDMDVYNQAKKKFAKQKDWMSYFELKNEFADLRDKAACTVYKAQGSTYDTVFVDVGNIGTSYEPDQVARMLFVAISRARHKVYLYGRLPSRYTGTKKEQAA